jgi:Ni/Fe-hydrogenase subunit HybB-like protein
MTGDPILAPQETDATITASISDLTLQQHTPLGWFIGFGVAAIFVFVFFYSVAWLLVKGIGIWGVNIPVAWGFAITNFVWWIGIGHAGTLISAILLLLHQRWRNSINRFAEAMTIFAVSCAGVFPLLHLGRPQVFYWLLPYPDTMKLWPQFRSPLVWDVFAVFTYLTVSLIFWYVGMIPDFATLRDRAVGRGAQFAYSILAMGWRGDSEHWERYEKTYLLMAGLATPLVVSVHSVVSLDFAVSQLPGWHSTVFPPYFVAGAIFSGFAMVLTIAIPLRAVLGLHAYVTDRHLDNMAKVMLASGLVLQFGYFNEYFLDWYSGDKFERFHFVTDATGLYALGFWLMMLCNVLLPQLLWIRRVRRNPIILFALSILINVGMWTERFVIIVGSLYRDFLPSSWGSFFPTIWDLATFAGTLGVFVALYFMFVRWLPIMSIVEVKKLKHE